MQGRVLDSYATVHTVVAHEDRANRDAAPARAVLIEGYTTLRLVAWGSQDVRPSRDIRPSHVVPDRTPTRDSS
jgi:hypothetical protein